MKGKSDGPVGGVWRGVGGSALALPSLSLRAAALLCLLLGASVGGASSVWQMATESAQVQAGLVQYPPGNVFVLYHHKLWTLSVQLPALLLAAGLEAAVANLLLTAGMGALAWLALGLTSYAMTRRPWFAVALPALVIAGDLYDVGTTYFIALFDNPHTFGIVATAWGLLVLAVLGLERWGWLGILLGLSPAVHPGTAPWVFGVVGLVLLWEPSLLRARVRAGATGFLTGAAVSIVSFAHHLWLSRENPPPPLDSARYLDAFIASWDDHRAPVPWASKGVLIGLLTILLCWGTLRQRDHGERPVLLLRAFLVSASLGLGMCTLSHAQGWLPMWVRVAMPWRNLNLTGLGFVPLLLGLLLTMRSRSRGEAAAAITCLALSAKVLWMTAPVVLLLPVAGTLLGILLLADGAEGGRGAAGDAAGILRNIGSGRRGLQRLRKSIGGSGIWLGLGLVIGLGWCCCADRLLELGLSPSVRIRLPWIVPGVAVWCGGMGIGLALSRVTRLHPGLRRAPEVVLLLPLGGVLVGALFDARALDARLIHAGNEALFARAARVPGLLLTSGHLTQIQLRTGRPVLLHGSNLNALPYVLESGPELVRVLREVYGIDLFDPPGRRIGGLAEEDGRPLWESRTGAEWRTLAEKEGLGAVMTPSRWTLDLPLLARNEQFSLYDLSPRPAGEVQDVFP